ncbi:MAG: hypothetical protein WBV11_07805 [Salegentibacter sp.]
MKKEKNSISDLLSRTIWAAGFICLLMMLNSCAKRVVFPASEMVPAAKAVVQIDKSKNANYNIALKVDNLAEPERLTPSRKYYSVWMETKKHGTLNIGNLKVNRKNKASLETVTPYEPIRIYITAEDKQDPGTPSTQTILNSEDFKV